MPPGSSRAGPSRAAGLASRMSPWGFAVFYLGWAYLFWIPVLGSDTSVWSGRNLVLLAFWLAFDLVMALAAVVLGVTSTPLEPDWALLANPGPIAFLVVLSFVLPAVEEVGLRGYYADTTFDPALSWWLPMIVLDTVLIVWIYERTGRSILAALLFHGMMNLTGEVLAITAEMYPFVLTGHALAAGAVILWWWHRGVAGEPASSPAEGRGERIARSATVPPPGSSEHRAFGDGSLA